MKNIFGENTVWWIGIVEKRDDNFKIGRCKVRIFHHHTADTVAMPTDSLPWAYSITPLNDSLFSTPKEGETVIGIFLDEGKQSPLMIGRLPAKEQNSIKSTEGSGFVDARTQSELSQYPRQLISNLNFAVDGNGVTSNEFQAAFKYPYDTGHKSTPFLSTNENIPTQIDPVAGTLKTTGITAKGLTWLEPTSPYGARYPFNHVYESESKHVLEFDDTPGAERVRMMHRLGSGTEYHTSGDVVQKVVKDGYTVVLGKNRLQVYGDCDITIDGDSTMYVKGDHTQRIDGDYNLHVGGNFKYVVKKDHIGNVSGDSKHKADGEVAHKAGGTLYLVGEVIHENSSSDPNIPDIQAFDLPSAPAQPLSLEAQKPLIDSTGTSISTDDDATTTVGQPTPENTAIPVSTECPVVENGAFVDGDERYRIPISKYYQIADLTVRPVYKHNMVAQNGLNEHDLVCNLSYLCKNVLDKILEKYPGFTINSGFRTRQNGTSQHEFGEAADIQWSNIRAGSLSKYLEIANWVAENLPFDQIILEHGNTIWLHISLKRNGFNRKQKLTMHNGVYTPGFDLKGRA